MKVNQSKFRPLSSCKQALLTMLPQVFIIYDRINKQKERKNVAVKHQKINVYDSDILLQ